MKRYVVALDQGTTSSRCIIFDREQNIIGTAQREFTQHYPQPGWVEQDPMEIWSSQYSVLTEALAQSGGGAGGGSRHRDYQPAGDHRGLGPQHRTPDL